MTQIPMEKLLKNAHDSTYKLVMLAARRSLELGSGSEKLVEAKPTEKITSIALKEIEENKITYKVKKKEG